MADDPILVVEEQLRDAMLAGDVAALDRLIDDDLMFVSHLGGVVGKAEDLEMHRSKRLRITSMTPSDRRIQRLGDTVVVVSVQMHTTAIVEGVDVEETFRYTRVWRRRPDGWKIVSGQMTIVAR
jgi:ketosteroid isomerase-like protein